MGGYDSIAQKIQAQRNEEIDEKSTISTESFEWNSNNDGNGLSNLNSSGDNKQQQLTMKLIFGSLFILAWIN